MEIPIALTERFATENESIHSYRWEYDAAGRLTKEVFQSNDPMLDYTGRL